jgi:hypothetical protein
MLTPRDARTRIARILKSLDLNTSPSNRSDGHGVLTEVWLPEPDAQQLATTVRALHPGASVLVGPDPRPSVRKSLVEIRWRY